MRKVELKKVKNLTLDDLNDSMLIGVEFKRGHRGFIDKINFSTYIITTTDVKNDSFASKIEGISIKNFIENCVDVVNVEVTEDPLELLEWLSEQYKEKAL